MFSDPFSSENENKSELKNLRELMERIEGERSGMIFI